MPELALPAIFFLLAALLGAIALVRILARGRQRPRSSKRVTHERPQTPRRASGEQLPEDPAAINAWFEAEEEGAAREAVPTDDLPYTCRRYLLTQAEREFFEVLRAAAPEGWYVFPQVRLANLLMLRKGTRNWKPHFSRVAQKCVDFVFCDGAEIGPRLVVELDDASHDRSDRQRRDAFVDAALRSAGLPVLHVRWRRNYDRAELASQIRHAAGLAGTPAGAALPVAQAPAPPHRPEE